MIQPVLQSCGHTREVRIFFQQQSFPAAREGGSAGKSAELPAEFADFQGGAVAFFQPDKCCLSAENLSDIIQESFRSAAGRCTTVKLLADIPEDSHAAGKQQPEQLILHHGIILHFIHNHMPDPVETGGLRSEKHCFHQEDGKDILIYKMILFRNNAALQQGIFLLKRPQERGVKFQDIRCFA